MKVVDGEKKHERHDTSHTAEGRDGESTIMEIFINLHLIYGGHVINHKHICESKENSKHTHACFFQSLNPSQCSDFMVIVRSESRGKCLL